MLPLELSFLTHFIWLKNHTHFYERDKGFVSILFVNGVVQYGNTMNALKVMVYIKRLSFVNMWQNSVVVIEGQSAMVFCSRQLSWLLIEKSFIR